MNISHSGRGRGGRRYRDELFISDSTNRLSHSAELLRWFRHKPTHFCSSIAGSSGLRERLPAHHVGVCFSLDGLWEIWLVVPPGTRNSCRNWQLFLARIPGQFCCRARKKKTSEGTCKRCSWPGASWLTSSHPNFSLVIDVCFLHTF